MLAPAGGGRLERRAPVRGGQPVVPGTPVPLCQRPLDGDPAASSESTRRAPGWTRARADRPAPGASARLGLPTARPTWPCR